MEYTVISAQKTNSYHIHGSWFEHWYEMELIDVNGQRSHQRLHADKAYTHLTNKTIQVSSSGEFELVKQSHIS